MKPIHIISTPGSEYLVENPLLYIPFKGTVEQEGTHRLKEGFTIMFRLETQGDQTYQIEVEIKSKENFRTSFLMRETFSPAEHLPHEICIPTRFLLEHEPLSEILLRAYAEYLNKVSITHGILMKIIVNEGLVSMELCIGTYKGSDTLHTEEGITDEVLEELFQKND